ncbi:hypothetical protein CBP51_15075 [Cellvibrio mixtus]|uniref:Uncharacterized protein n=1 Tax=Cellvibrio mixtus TaxID=39650 RepID=A0A266Q3U0_9GAMM|nr:hypothetical protein [Cellvibrio mixtus]OZY84515.1 hypothetical protein CBP51_15075 [Cellvibrio mixtus]
MDILNEVLTEFDDAVGIELNVDPLGLLVIWSTYGQNIFRHRISSISNDVRNFTLNLFNHAVIRSLIEDDEVVLGKGLRNLPAYGERGKDSAAFKQACLIYLENAFTYTMIEAQSQNGVETTGVLGISKARRRWDETQGNPPLRFSHESNAHILVRQHSLGVSGRYKTPLVEMKFFDGTYDYALPESRVQWEKVRMQLLAKSKPLANLYNLTQKHLAELLTDAHRIPECNFSDLPRELKRAFVAAFSSPATVGEYTHDFWLEVTDLNQGAPGALYKVLELEWKSTSQHQERQTAGVFALAAANRSLSIAEKTKLEYVCVLEPFLAEIDLMLSVMLSAKSQTLVEATNKWRSLGRTARTLPDSALLIRDNPNIQAQTSGTASARLTELLLLACSENIEQQMEGLLRYHEKVMQARSQSPWLRLVGGIQLKVDVRTRQLPTRNERPVGAWVHHYYIPQFRHLLSGMRGIV